MNNNSALLPRDLIFIEWTSKRQSSFLHLLTSQMSHITFSHTGQIDTNKKAIKLISYVSKLNFGKLIQLRMHEFDGIVISKLRTVIKYVLYIHTILHFQELTVLY